MRDEDSESVTGGVLPLQLSTLDPFNIPRFQPQSISNGSEVVLRKIVFQHPLHLVEVSVMPDP